MRILFLSNFYPPARPGGYTQWCYEVAEGLKARGHVIAVLTSRHECDKALPTEQDIYRLLHLDGELEYYSPRHFFVDRNREQQENRVIMNRVVADFAPDIVFVWGMWAMSKDLSIQAEALLPGRVVYFLSDYWPAARDMHRAYWTNPANRWFMRLPKKGLGAFASAMLGEDERPHLVPERTICVSRAVRDILVEAGYPLQDALVIHGGTDVSRFPEPRERDFRSRPMPMLYAGQLVEHKGVHTAIKALNIVVNEHGIKDVRLNIVGSGHPSYEKDLRDMVSRSYLREFVSFQGPVSRSEMPAILLQSDVLIFPSIYEEPFARMTQEAMLAGLLVVGTTTGGTKELLVEGENGLTFAPEDSHGLAQQIMYLNGHPDSCQRMAEAGRRTVLENYTLEHMVGRIEHSLIGVAAQPVEVRPPTQAA